MRPRQKTIPTIIGVIVLVLGVAVGVLATQYKAIFKLGAQTDVAPQDVRITNLAADSATISWITDKPATGIVLWGNSTATDRTTTESDAAKTVHYLSLADLTPSTTYYFKINSGGQEYENNGSLWQFQTPGVITPPTDTKVISGTILSADGQPASGVIVYVTAEGISQMSAKTSETGNWIIPFGLARSTANMNTYAQITNTTLLQIFVQAGPAGVATAQAYPPTASPTPSITIGQTHDFRQTNQNTNGQLSDPSIEVGEDQESSASGFGFLTDFLDQQATDSASSSTVTLESIEHGEIVSTQKPEFFGEGPAGITLTITVESDPITDEVTVASNGIWKWSPPTNLPEGEHTVTLNWIDASGIARTLTRTFVVSAQEGASFEASSSATATPSSTPKATKSPTPKPSISPTASSSASPSASPRISHPSTDSGTPVAGSLTPTIVLSIMGIGLFVAAFFISAKAT